MINVLNKHIDTIPNNEYTVYIGRGSKFGNPYSHLPNTLAKFTVRSRNEAVNKFTEFMLSDTQYISEILKLVELYKAQQQLNLVCFCAPKSCHGHVIKKFIEFCIETETKT